MLLASRRGLIKGLVLTFALWVGASASILEAQPSPIPIPTVALQGTPQDVLIGETFHFKLIFRADSVNTGFGPFVEIYLEYQGADCTKPPPTPQGGPCDGLQFVQAAAMFANGNVPLTPVPAGCPFVFPSSPSCPKSCTGPCSPASGEFFGALPPSPLPGFQKIVLMLPFGSFVPGQPDVEIDVAVRVHAFADAGVPLQIQARGGFRFGGNVLGGSPPSVGPFVTASVTPHVFTLRKIYLGPEGETATGPNFPRQYRLEVDVADGQDLSDLKIEDCLPGNLTFLSLSSSTPSPTGPPIPLPDNCFEVTFGSITGGPGGPEVVAIFNFFVPELDEDGDQVLDSSCRAASLDRATVSAVRTPQDPRDLPASTDSVTAEHTLTDKCLALQKSVSVAVDTGAPGPTPGDVLEYTLSFQLSDFRTVRNLVVDDYLSDGQTLVSGPQPPSLDIRDQFGGSFTGVFIPGLTLTQSVVPTAPCGAGDPAVSPRRLRFLVSNLLASLDPGHPRHLLGILTGGHASQPAGGAATGRIVFLARINDKYQRQPATREAFVDKGDPLRNCAIARAQVLRNANAPALPGPALGPTTDSSATKVETVVGRLTKTVYAINGKTSFPKPPKVDPGDRITFRIRYPIPSSDAEKLKIVDYSPIPVLPIVPGFQLDTGSCSNLAPPPVNVARKVGKLCTDFPGKPIATFNGPAAPNSLTFNYGNLQHTDNATRVVDLLYTVKVSTAPFTDGLLLTNEVYETEQNTFGQSSAQAAIAQITLCEPKLRVRKGVASTNKSTAVFNPDMSAPSGVTFLPPPPKKCNPKKLKKCAPAFTGTITSSNVESALHSDLSGVDACDSVKYAIVIENLGCSTKGAFDVQLHDLLPGCVGSRSNLQVRKGNGAPLTCNGGQDCDIDSLFLATGITLDDAPGAGALGPYSPVGGNNIVVITFDAQTPCEGATPGCCTNTAQLDKYAGVEGGPNHRPQNLSTPFPGTTSAFMDSANVCIRPALAKSIVGTSEPHTTKNVDGVEQLAIGEIVTYKLEVAVPEGISPDMRIIDTLPSALEWQLGSCSVTTSPSISAANPLNVVLSGASLSLTLGDVTNNANNPDVETITIVCKALVLNHPANVKPASKPNSFSVQIKGITYTSNSVQAVIVEPMGTVTKQELPSASVSSAIYVLGFVNTGTATAFDVTLLDNLPVPLTVSGTPQSTGTAPCSVVVTASSQVKVTCAEVPVGANVKVQLDVVGVPLCRPLTNVATLDFSSLPGPQGTGSVTPGASGAPNGERVYPSSASVSTAHCADLVLTKSHAADFPLGQTGTYTFKVQNTGNAPSVPPDTVKDSLPSGLLFLSGGGNGWTCTSTNGRDVTCTSSTPIPPGGSSSFTITVAVPCGLSPVQNCADVATTAEIDQADNRSCDSTRFTSSNPGCVSPPRSMAAWWPFDEPAGPTAADLAGSAQDNGTYQPALAGPTPQPGRVAYSLCFDGVDDRVDVPDGPDLDLDTGDFTIDTWIRTTAGQGIQTIVDKRDAAPAARGYAFFLFNGRVALQMATGAGTNNCSSSAADACTNYFGTTTPNIADGQWHHVAVTVDRDNPQGGVFYVDGQPFPATFNPTFRAQSLGNTAGARIGERAQAQQVQVGPARLRGCLDELEVFKRALSTTEIKSIFDAGSAGKCKCANCNAVDKVPVATLLLPYFEVDLDNPSGITTLFSINNAAASPVLTHVTIWSDQAVPVFAFNVYLPGLGSQGLNLRDILIDGNLPGTAPVPPIPSCSQLPYPPGALSAALRSHLQRWLVGRRSDMLGTNQCAGQNYGDNIARGYVTVDAVSACTSSSLSPANWALYAPFISNQNVLSGDYSYVDPSHNACHTADLVHIEACPTCFKPGEHTFYGRYNGASAADAREPLPTTFEASVASSDPFAPSPVLVVWRETNASASSYACGLDGPPSWYPLDAKQIVSFDNTGLSCQSQEPIPNAASSISVSSLSSLETTKVYLNLQHSKVTPIYGDSAAQAWVAVVKTFSPTCARDPDAIQLDCANAPLTSVISTNLCQ